MSAKDLEERYAGNLHGVLSCFDRIIIVGTMPGACYAQGMTSFLYQQSIRIFDYAKFAEPLRDRIRERAHQVCADAGVEIEHVRKSDIRKEERVARVLRFPRYFVCQRVDFMLPVFPDFAFYSSYRGTGAATGIPEWNAVACGCKTPQYIESSRLSFRHEWRSECHAPVHF